MSLVAHVRFLKGVPAGTASEAVLTLRCVLPDGSEHPAHAHTARFASSAPPLDVTLLLDTSGSMKPFEDMLRISTQTLIRLLPVPLSHVRIVTFDNLASERRPRTHLATSDDRTELLDWSSSLRVSRGSTNMHDALTMLSPTPAQQFVVLLSDGHANLGVSTDPETLCSVARDSLSSSVSPVLMSCIGFNEPKDLQMPLLTGLASLCDGSVHIVQAPEKVHEAFGDIVGDMVSTLCANVTVRSCATVTIDSQSFTDKLGGLHVRLGAPRHIPLTVTDKGQIVVTFWDALSGKMTDLVVDVSSPPTEQAMDWSVHESLLLSKAARAVKDVKDAKTRIRHALSVLGPSPRASFFSPIHVGGTGARGLDNEPPSPKRAALPERVARLHDEMYHAWIATRDGLICDEWNPVKRSLEELLANLDTNPNKSSRLLSGLAAELKLLRDTTFDDVSLDDRTINLAFDLVHQRSGVRDAVAPLGALDFDLTASQMASRLVSRTLSQRPDVSADTAAEMLHNSLTADPCD